MKLITLDEYIKRLKELSTSDNLFARISLTLLHNLNNKNEITTSSSMCDELFISKATMSKFVRQMNFVNFEHMKFVHNGWLTKAEKEETISKNVNNNVNINFVEEVANQIQNSRKVFFVGVGSSYICNLDFANKLQRLDIWTLCSHSKYDQVGLSNLLGPEDFLIVTSVSLQHSWMKEVIRRSSKCPTLLISSGDLVDDNLNVKWYVDINAKERTDAFRLYTEKSRVQIIEFFDSIFKELVKSKSLNENLQKSAYMKFREYLKTK